MSDNPTFTIKDLSIEEQPREKALRYGMDSLTNSELLALILRTGLPGVPITQMTRNLLNAYGGSLHALMRRTEKEFQMIEGMGPVKAQQVKAIMALVKRFVEEEFASGMVQILSSRDIFNNLRLDIGNEPREQIWLLTLNRANRIIGRHHLTSGSSVASVFDLRNAVKLAILDEASAIILSHNHPSGNTRPSPQDDAITQSLKKAAQTLDMRLLDHVIITADSFYSYADEGRL